MFPRRERRFEFRLDIPKYFNIVPRHRALLRRERNIARESETGLSYFVISRPRAREHAVKHYFSLLNDLSPRNRSLLSGDVNIILYDVPQRIYLHPRRRGSKKEKKMRNDARFFSHMISDESDEIEDSRGNDNGGTRCVSEAVATKKRHTLSI